MELHREAAVRALSGSGASAQSQFKAMNKRQGRGLSRIPVFKPTFADRKAFLFRSVSRRPYRRKFRFVTVRVYLKEYKLQGKCMKGAHTQSDPSRSVAGKGGVAGARRGGNLWRPPLRLRTLSAAASQGGATSLGTGQRIPGRRACCPVVTPGPCFAGVNDRRRRRATGAARSGGGPSHPSAVTTSPYRLATPRGSAIGRAAPPPTCPRLRIGRRPGIARPAPRPFPLCAAGTRGRCAIRPRLDRHPPSLRVSHGAGADAPQCTYPRGGGREIRKGPRPRGIGAASSPARPGQPIARHAHSAWPSTASSAGRGARVWPGAAGKGARLCPPRPGQDPLLPWTGSGGQGLASPRV